MSSEFTRRCLTPGCSKIVVGATNHCADHYQPQSPSPAESARQRKDRLKERILHPNEEPKLNAELGNKEFDPTKEKHHFGFVVKSVNPGCTLEMQIEDNEGNVTRVTSTENKEEDKYEFSKVVLEAFERWFDSTF